MIRTLLLGTLLAILLAGFAGQAQAHSTAGRVKVDLDWAEPTVDDFAFFIESYVHRELYRGVYEQWEKRFYVKEFTGVELQPGGALVRFATLDQKLRRDFADEMRFGRGEDGVWYHPAADGGQVRVYSYIPKWRHYYQTYILPGSAAGLVLALFALLLVRRRRRRLTLPSAG